MQPCSHGDLLAEYRALGDDDKQLAAYLRTLIERYQMVTKIEPIFAKPASRKSRYVITDNFLAAWLAAIARGVEKARIRPIDEAVVDVGTRLDTLEGFTFEKMVRALVEEASRAGSSEFHLSEQVRGYWDKPNRGNASIEIDLIAFDEASRKVMFGSCKRNAKKFTDASLRLFRDHVSGFLRESAGTRFSEFSHGFALFAPTFLPEDRDALHLAGFQCFDIGDLGAAVAPQLFAARG